MERMEINNPREVVRRLFQQAILEIEGAAKFDPLAYFEKNVDWHQANKLLLYMCKKVSNC